MIRISMCTYAYMYECMYIYIYIYRERERDVYTCMHTHTHIYIYTHTHIYTYTYIYIYIYIHTHIHIQVDAPGLGSPSGPRGPPATAPRSGGPGRSESAPPARRTAWELFLVMNHRPPKGDPERQRGIRQKRNMHF